MFFNAWRVAMYIHNFSKSHIRTRGLNRDEEFYPEPEKFKPERWLDADGQLAEPLEDTHGQGHLGFGSGRRICAGMYVANQSLFIDTASLLWAFDVLPASMDDGSIMPSRENDTGDGLLV